MRKLKTVVVTAALFLMSAQVGSEPYHYVHTAPESRHFVVRPKEGQVIAGDQLRAADFCGPREKFHCFKSEWMTFASPRVRLQAERAWEFGGYQFNETRKRQIMLFGRRVEVVEIASKQKDVEFIFLYSKSIGLVGFLSRVDGTWSDYLLEEVHGFGGGG